MKTSMSSVIGAQSSIFSNADKGVLIMASKQTSQRKKTTTAQADVEAKTDNATTISTTATKPGRPAAPQNRKAKFYDDVLNCRLRELMDGREARTEELANAVGIGSSAVRMWYTGYARPDIEKIPAICKFYEVSADWLLGISETQAVDIEMRNICEKTGLSDHALLNLMRYSENQKGNMPPTSNASATAAERLWLINNLIEDEETINTLADNANLCVNIRKAIDNLEIPEYDGESAVTLMKLGVEKFGIMFNFTQGKETADYHVFMCHRYFVDFIEGLEMPAYWLKGLTEKD